MKVIRCSDQSLGLQLGITDASKVISTTNSGKSKSLPNFDMVSFIIAWNIWYMKNVYNLYTKTNVTWEQRNMH